MGATLRSGAFYKKIENITIGDMVLAIDERTGEQSYRPVKQLFIRTAPRIYNIHYEDGTVIETTWSHPFYIKRSDVLTKARMFMVSFSDNRSSSTATMTKMTGLENGQWIDARDIRAGDVSVTASGKDLRIVKMSVDYSSETVYNFTVDEHHNYFVSESGVLVHNVDYGGTIIAGSNNSNKVFEIGKNCILKLDCSTDGELALKQLLEPGNLSQKLELQISKKSKIVRRPGEAGVTIYLENGETLNLSSTKELEELLNGSGGLSQIDDVKTVDQLLNNAIPKYYSKFSSMGGNPSAANTRGSGQFNYSGTQQVSAASPQRIGADGKPYTYYNYKDKPSGTITDPDSYLRNNPRFGPGNLLCNQLNCSYSAKINMLKSAGMINPKQTAFETERLLKQNRSNLRRIPPDNDVLNRGARTDWAQLSGASKFKYNWKPMGQLNSSTARNYVNGGNILLMRGRPKNISHIYNIKSYNWGNARYNVDDPIPGYVRQVPKNLRGELWGLNRTPVGP